MILAPTLTLSAGSGAAIVRPTFSRDFAGEKSLNNGTGPAITFTRASNATYFNAAGTLTTATTNEPRFDHNPSTGASLGLLIEEARTNSIRNSQAGGSTNGVIGSGGVMPTNWSVSTHTGIVYEVIGTGTSSGFSYIDIKISGTNSSGSSVTPAINLETSTQVVAATGQTWTGSSYVALVGGSLAGVFAVEIDLVERSVGGSYLAGTQSNISLTVTSSLQRFSTTRTFNQATAERTTVRIVSNVPNGNTVDLTLRIAAPQLEQGAFPTSYIPTTTAAATRAADSAVVTPISGFYNQSEGTLFAEFTQGFGGTSAGSNLFSTLVGFGPSAGDSRTEIYTQLFSTGATHANAARIIDASNVTQANAGFNNLMIAGTIYRFAAGMAADNVATFRNGTAGGTDTSVAMPSNLDRMGIGHGIVGASNLGQRLCHIRRIAYYPRRLSNALLQQLTT